MADKGFTVLISTIDIMSFNEPDKFSTFVNIRIITNIRSIRNYS